ncbi:MAG: hypothetical protein ACI8QC_003530 [Planctomycetota bacterium]|jgi:hypothetical protein
MKLTRLAPPVAALAAAALFTVSQSGAAFNLLGHKLGPGQRDFRVFNNFVDFASNNNQTPDPNFPGGFGAVQAIWKGAIEWGSTLHGDGGGDPHQPLGLGSGLANFDPSFQGEANVVGSVGDNIESPLSGSSGGVLAFAEIQSNGNWRIRYYESWTWNDGPNTNINGGHFDLQSVACHEYGHCLGMGHSQFGSATMAPSVASGTVTQRSISNDDRNGIQAKYGVVDPGKPLITGVVFNGTSVQITGSNFDASGNDVWFTRVNFQGNGDVLTVSNVASTGGGTSMTVTVPNDAQSGDILVRNGLTGAAGISNAMPLDISGPMCPAPSTVCVGNPNSVSGGGAVLSVSGSQNVAANDTVLTTLFVPPNQFGIYIYGLGTTSISVGDGTLCVAAPFIRFPAQQIDAFGAAILPLDFNNMPAGGDILQGDTWNFQLWFRDPTGGPSGNNLSSTVEVQFCN